MKIKKREDRAIKWTKKAVKAYDREKLEIGDQVLIKNMSTKKYNIKGTIVDDRRAPIARDGAVPEDHGLRSRSFVVEGDKGGVYLRNAKFLKLNKVDEVADA